MEAFWMMQIGSAFVVGRFLSREEIIFGLALEK